MKTYKELKEYLLKETTLNRVLQHANDETYPIAIVTASQYKDKNDKVISKKQNIDNNNKLATELNRARIQKKIQSYFMVDGTWVYKDGTKVKDDSYFVIGNKEDKGELLNIVSELGKKYNQESILYRPAKTNVAVLVDMGDNSVIRLGPIQANRVSDIYSRLRGRSGTFVFGDDE